MLRGARSELLVTEFVSFEGFIMDFVKGWDPVVPFQQGSGVADQIEGMPVHLPDWIEHGMIVGIEEVFLELRMAGDMDLANPMMRNVIKVIVGIEVVVL